MSDSSSGTSNNSKETLSLSSSSEGATVPSPAILQLLSPDGYYSYLGVKKEINEDTVKKNYRRLSLKHHPDRPTGDADTFRVLNRAQTVLLNPKLRKQYDLIGLDLLDDEQTMGDDDNSSSNSQGGDDQESQDPESVVSQIASMALAGILQVIVRTVMMSLVAILVVRYRLLLYPAMLFLIFVAYRIFSVSSQSGASSIDVISPVLIAVGLMLMHIGRDVDKPWSWTFWAGETMVMSMFTFNSIPVADKSSQPIVLFVVPVVAVLLALWMRGRLWSYVTLVGLECFVAAVAALGFPMMEMILEQILNEKLAKVGEKVRAHAKRMEAYYNSR